MANPSYKETTLKIKEMKKVNILVALAATFFAFLGAKAQDTVTILPPFKGIEEAFVMKYYQINYDSVYQVVSVSTSGASGYYPINHKKINRDTIKKLFANDTMRKGLPTIKYATPFDVKIELFLMDMTTLVASSAVTTVTVQPRPLKPLVSVISSVNNNKVFVNLGLDINVECILRAYTVTKASDTLNPQFPRKSWTLSNTSLKSFIDSSYITKNDVWMCYEITTTVDGKLTTKTKWVFVPGYTKPAIADVGINQPKDSTTSILKINGWAITKNLPLLIKLAIASGDTMLINLPASNGLSYWSAVAVNRTPGKTYNIIAYAINSIGKGISNMIVHTMGSNPSVVTITALNTYSSGTNLVVDFSYYLPTGKTGAAIISYALDTDPNFNEPQGGSSFEGLSGSSAKNAMFTNLAPGKYWVRCELNDGKDLVTKIVPFTLHPLSVNKVTLNRISFWPNPASNVLNLNIPSNCPYTITNVFGQSLQNGIGSKIDVSTLAKGFYFIRTEIGFAKFEKQ